MNMSKNSNLTMYYYVQYISQDGDINVINMV